MVQGLLALAKVSGQTLIQALFFKFLSHPHGRQSLNFAMESQLEKTPLVGGMHHHFLLLRFPLVEEPSPTLPPSHSL